MGELENGLKTAKDITGLYKYIGYFHEHTWNNQKHIAVAINLPHGFNYDIYDFTLTYIASIGHAELDKTKFNLRQGVSTVNAQILISTDSDTINLAKDSFALIDYTITKKY